jgi:hypothetical protein
MKAERVKYPPMDLINQRRPLMSLATALTFFLLPGCITFYSFKPVEVNVVDAETGRPIPKATIDIAFGHDVNLFNPREIHAETDENGHAVLRVGARTGGVEGNAHWGVSASGYTVESGETIDGRRIPDRFRVQEDDMSGARVASIRLFIWEHRASQPMPEWQKHLERQKAVRQ